MATFRFPVMPDYIRVINDPQNQSVRTTFALVNVLDFDKDLPLSPNPRVPKKNRVTQRIVRSLTEWDGMFHILNRGITISAKSVDYDNQDKVLELVVPEDDDNYGVLDGGHTKMSVQAVLGDLAKRPLPEDARDQYVRLEILQGVEDILPKVAAARNFSENVNDLSLANYEARLEWLKDSLGDLADSVSWFQNDEGSIDATELLQIMAAMNPHQFSRTKQPLEAYKNAGKCLEYATDQRDEYRYKWLAPIAKDIWRLYDTIRDNWWSEYAKADPETQRRGRPRATAEATARKRGKARLMKYVTLGKEGDPERDLHVEKGLAIPLLAGFRALLREKPGASEYEWQVDPFVFFERHGQILVRKVMEASDARGKNPHTVGRDPTVYDSLYEAIELRLLREGESEQQG